MGFAVLRVGGPDKSRSSAPIWFQKGFHILMKNVVLNCWRSKRSDIGGILIYEMVPSIARSSRTEVGSGARTNVLLRSVSRWRSFRGASALPRSHFAVRSGGSTNEASRSNDVASEVTRLT